MYLERGTKGSVDRDRFPGSLVAAQQSALQHAGFFVGVQQTSGCHHELSGGIAVRVLQNWLRGSGREPRSTRLFRRRIESGNDLRLTLGSESVCMPGWIPASVDQLDLLCSASWSAFFQRSSVDAILAENVWDHLTGEEGRTAARNCFQFLRPAGYLRVAVPDGFHPSHEHLGQVPPGSDIGAARQKALYDHLSFSQMFLDVGFHVRLIEYFDCDGVFHTNHWDVSKGLIKRSLLFDERNVGQPYAYTSLILDAFKPDAVAMGITSSPPQRPWQSIRESGERNSVAQDLLQKEAA